MMALFQGPSFLLPFPELSDNRPPPHERPSSQSRFIIGTEACERFSFYGMKSILMLYMTGHLLMSENWATSTLHIFVGMVYLLPVAGAWLADKVWGRYKTILYISLLYCVGHGVLATADLFQTIEARRYILMAGLLIIALGPAASSRAFPPSWGTRFRTSPRG